MQTILTFVRINPYKYYDVWKRGERCKPWITWSLFSTVSPLKRKRKLCGIIHPAQ